MYISFQDLIAKASSGYEPLMDVVGPYDTQPKGSRPAAYMRGAVWLFGTPSDQWSRIPTQDGAILQSKGLRPYDDSAYSTPLSSEQATQMDIIRYAFALPSSCSQYTSKWATKNHVVDCSNIDCDGRRYFISADGQLDCNSDTGRDLCFDTAQENADKGLYHLGRYTRTPRGKPEIFANGHVTNYYSARFGGGRRDMLAKVNSDESDRTWGDAVSATEAFFATAVGHWRSPDLESPRTRAVNRTKITECEPRGSTQVFSRTHLETGDFENPRATSVRVNASVIPNKPYFSILYPQYKATEVNAPLSLSGTSAVMLKTEDIGKGALNLKKVAPGVIGYATQRSLAVAATKLSRITSLLTAYVTATSVSSGGTSRVLSTGWHDNWHGLVQDTYLYGFLTGMLSDIAIWYSKPTWFYNSPEYRDLGTPTRYAFALPIDAGAITGSQAHALNPFTDYEWATIGNRLGETEPVLGSGRIEFQYTDAKWAFLDSLALLNASERVIPGQEGPVALTIRDELNQVEENMPLVYPDGGDVNLTGETTYLGAVPEWLVSTSGLAVLDVTHLGSGANQNSGWTVFDLSTDMQMALYQAWPKCALPMLFLGKVALNVHAKMLTQGFTNPAYREAYPPVEIQSDYVEGAKVKTIHMIMLPSAPVGALYSESASVQNPWTIADHGKLVAHNVGLTRRS